MISEHLIEELRQLNRVEKLRVIQMLANQIAEEETIWQTQNMRCGRPMMLPVLLQF